MRAKYIFLALSLLGNQAIAKNYSYIDYSVPEASNDGFASFTLDMTSGRVTSVDWSDALFLCDDSSRFYCFEAPFISFYVPKNNVVKGMTWSASGKFFKASGVGSIDAFGEKRKVWVIESVQGDRTVFFYYSTRRGLLAIKFVPQNSGRISFFVISESSGFPR